MYREIWTLGLPSPFVSVIDTPIDSKQYGSLYVHKRTSALAFNHQLRLPQTRSIDPPSLSADISMSNTARTASTAAHRVQFRPRAGREDAKQKGKGPRNSTLSQNVSEASTSQSPGLRAVQGRSTKVTQNRRAPTHCKAV